MTVYVGTGVTASAGAVPSVGVRSGLRPTEVRSVVWYKCIGK